MAILEYVLADLALVAFSVDLEERRNRFPTVDALDRLAQQAGHAQDREFKAGGGADHGAVRRNEFVND